MGLATSAFIFVNSVLIGFATVIGVSIAQAVGTGDAKRVSNALGSGLMLASILSIVAMLAMVVAGRFVFAFAPDPLVASLTQQYWQTLILAAAPHTLLAATRSSYAALGHPWTALAITLIGIGLNIPLNLLLIYGGLGLDGYGIYGAGLASFLAKALTLGFFFLHWRASRGSHISTTPFHVSLPSILSQARDGLPVAIGSIAEGGAYAVTGFLAAQLSASALAAHQIVHSIGVVFYMVPIGMMIASSIRTGQLVGAGRKPEVFCTLRAANLIILSWSALVLLAVLAIRVPLAHMLSPTPEISAVTAVLFIAMAFVQFADGVQSTAMGVLRGMSDNLIPNAITVMSYWLGALPFAALLGFWFELGVVGISFGYGTAVLGVALVLQSRATCLLDWSSQ